LTTVAAAVASGVGVLLAGSLPWMAFLAPLNLRFLTAVPWAVVPMAAYLWIYWRFIRGERLRANPVPGEAWGMALLTGLAGFGALLAFASVMARFVTVAPAQPITSPPGMPPPTMFVLLVMASIVAGVTEEAGFRGYMQGPIEQRYGLAVAILVNGTVFGLLHFLNHPDQVLVMLPYYIAVTALYSGITWATNSILPSLVLHAGGDVWSLTRFWATGRPEWQIAPQTGSFGDVIVLLLFTAAAWWLCMQTARLARPPMISDGAPSL
jgi:membrane protease YdiL (CAAX protease family)